MTSNNNDFLVWNFDFALTTFYEVDAFQLETLIPPQLSLQEAAPGVGLINVTAFNFVEGQLGVLPEFQELILSAIVAPDLRRGVPSAAMFVLSLTSTCQEHLDHSHDYYKLPIVEKLTVSLLNKKNHEINFEDGEGKIAQINNCAPIIEYDNSKRYFQAFTKDGDDILISDMFIETPLFEHQENGDTGKLYEHPFFKGIEVDDPDVTNFLQMVNEPGSTGKQTYYKPTKFF